MPAMEPRAALRAPTANPSARTSLPHRWPPPIRSPQLQLHLHLRPAEACLHQESAPRSAAAGPRIRWSPLEPGAVLEQQMEMIRALPRKLPKRCRAILERLICFSSSDVDHLLAAWVRSMRPLRADWLPVLKQLNLLGSPILPEVMEFALREEAFEANARDYTKLIHIYAERGLLRSAEDAVRRMEERGFVPDQVTLTVLIDMYGKAGDVGRAEAAFDDIKLLGLPVDRRAYGAMVMALVRSGMLARAEALMKAMEEEEVYGGREVYKALLRAYSLAGDAGGAQRVFDAVQFAGIVPDAKLCALLVNAYCMSSRTMEAQSVVANMRAAGVPPSDRCVALVLGAMEKEERLEAALEFLAELEEGGVAVGEEASRVLAAWLRRIGVVEEVGQLLHQLCRERDPRPKAY